ncbi:hypothetical protein ABPG75_008048 [Micractinium tetrahymenae]
MAPRSLGQGLRGLGARRADPRLFDAAEEGDADRITQLLAEGALPDARRQDDNCTALELAAAGGHAAAVHALLAGGAAADAPNPAEYDIRPLAVAALQGHPEALAALLEAGADPYGTNEVGCSALYFCAASGSTECATLLLDAGAQPVTNQLGQSPLHLGSEKGHAPFVELLLTRCPGVEVSAGDQDGQTPLHFACRCGKAEVARLLLEHGAELEAEDDDGYTPLMRAAAGGHTDTAALHLERGAARPTAQLLLRHGADALHADRGGCTPLTMALQRPRQTQLVAALLAGGAVASINAVDVMGCTALYFSAAIGNTAAARLLLEHGADPCICNRGGQSALHYAAQIGSEPLAELLLAAPGIEAVINARDTEGTTPLYFAVMGGSKGVARRLLARGARPDIPNNRGQTPLHLASQGGLSSIVSLLLKAWPEDGEGDDAAAFPREVYRYTPLHFAADQGRPKVARQLLAAQPEMAAARNLQGLLPVQLAVRKGFKGLARALLEEGEYFGEDSQCQADPELAVRKGFKGLARALLEEGEYFGEDSQCQADPEVLLAALKAAGNPSLPLGVAET